MKWTKLLIVSDSHGKFENLSSAIRKESPFDILVHCGDVGGNLEALLKEDTNFLIKAVKGNTDYFCSLPEDEEFKAGPYNIWVTHGDKYNVKYDYDLKSLKVASKKHYADIVLFGHSHHAEIQKDSNSDLLLINPGCIGIPRTNAEVSSYAVLRISDDYDIEYEIKIINGTEH